MESSNIIWIAISAIAGALLGRASVPAESSYYIKMSKAIIRANKNLKRDRDAWKAAVATEKKVNQELKKKVVELINRLDTTNETAADALASLRVQKEMHAELREKHTLMYDLMVKKGILTKAELQSIF